MKPAVTVPDSPASAIKTTMTAIPELFHRLPRNVLSIFSGRNLLWHALAIVLTIIIVMSGADWSYHLLTQGDVFFRFSQPAILLGTFVPVLGTLTLLILGKITRNRRRVRTAWALGQAAILGWAISSVYKAFTGRLPPPFSHHFLRLSAGSPPTVDSSHGFQFGLLKGGIFWGWPSSHTTVAFAMAACLIALFPKCRILCGAAFLYALYIGFSVSTTIHWLSEFVAGAIIGSVIGAVVGRSFKENGRR
jgi:membrane-associated phospholipid phosphatase